MTWLMKRHGSGGPSKNEDNTSDSVTSFAQIQKDRIKCHNCGMRDHYVWECPDLRPQQQAKYRKNSNKWKNGDSSVGSNGSSKSDGSGNSLGTFGSDSSGSASQLVRRRGSSVGGSFTNLVKIRP